MAFLACVSPTNKLSRFIVGVAVYFSGEDCLRWWELGISILRWGLYYIGGVRFCSCGLVLLAHYGVLDEKLKECSIKYSEVLSRQGGWNK